MEFLEQFPNKVIYLFTAHKYAFWQFPFGWIYYYGSNKSTGQEIGEIHLYALQYMLIRNFYMYLAKMLSKELEEVQIIM